MDELPKYWTIEYTKDFTEQIFDDFLLYLEENGYKKHIHCDFPISYSKFSSLNNNCIMWLRSGNTEGSLFEVSIDNNRQGIEEIKLEDILSLINKENEIIEENYDYLIDFLKKLNIN